MIDQICADPSWPAKEALGAGLASRAGGVAGSESASPVQHATLTAKRPATSNALSSCVARSYTTEPRRSAER
eukprot:2683990-Pleurochrysis_carterae.AAC.3